MDNDSLQSGFVPALGRILSRQGAFMLVGALTCFMLLPLYAGWLSATADAARLLIGFGVCGGFLMYTGETLAGPGRRPVVRQAVRAGDDNYPRKSLIKS